MITYQDFEKARDKTKFVQDALATYTSSKEWKKAQMEAEYMAGRDTAIIETVKVLYDMTGQQVTDFTASNNRISSNILHRLISDRCAYSLGNGVSFASANQQRGADGSLKTVDAVKDMLGDKFDTRVYKAAYWACGNGESYTFVHKGHEEDRWEFDVFTKREFLPLYDEYTGKLRGGIRFWSLDWHLKPIIAVLYTEEGCQRFEPLNGETGFGALKPKGELEPYKEEVQVSEADGVEVVASGNYSTLPIIPMYANDQHTSALDNLKAKIDALDLVVSGFANDMHDCAQIYWLVNGGMGMDDKDKQELRDKLLLQHMAVVDGDHSSISPYTQEPPYQARETFIQRMIDRIYADFGDVNVVQLSAQQRTATEIEAAYKPMDQEADTFEYELIEYIQQILALMGIKDTPVFKRGAITNEKEVTEMVMMAADHLDERTLLNKLPWVTVDEVEGILAAKDMENADRFTDEEPGTEEEENPDGNLR